MNRFLALALCLSIAGGCGASPAALAAPAASWDNFAAHNTPGPGWWAALVKTPSVVQGSGSRVLYMFMDPNCPYCHVTFDELQTLIPKSAVQVHYVLVGYLSPSSKDKAAAILQARDPLRALTKNEGGFKNGEFGAISPTLPSAKTDQLLAAHLKLLHQSGSRWVPVLAYRDQRGKVHIIQGAPSLSGLKDVLQQVS